MAPNSTSGNSDHTSHISEVPHHRDTHCTRSKLIRSSAEEHAIQRVNAAGNSPSPHSNPNPDPDPSLAEEPNTDTDSKKDSESDAAMPAGPTSSSPVDEEEDEIYADVAKVGGSADGDYLRVHFLEGTLGLVVAPRGDEGTLANRSAVIFYQDLYRCKLRWGCYRNRRG